MIRLENLSIASGGFSAQGLSFEVPTGQYAILMGRTGCGKTTLLETICGLKAPAIRPRTAPDLTASPPAPLSADPIRRESRPPPRAPLDTHGAGATTDVLAYESRPPRRGRILLMGEDVTDLPPADRGIGYVPQDRALFRTMTVRENLAFALQVRRWPRHRIDERVAELADLLGIASLLDRMPAGLSGGEAQRVALGRALAMKPRLLLLDEPLSALDDDTRHEMYELLRSVKQRTGVTTLHVTHSLPEARQLADRVFVFENGAITERPSAARKAIP